MADETEKLAPVEQVPEVDLEKVRDEKCFPIAQGVLEDMAELMMPLSNDSAAFHAPTMKILQRMLDADTNLVSENPYVFQLVLGAVSGMNTALQSCTTVPMDDDRYSEIAKKMLTILAKGKVKLGTLTPEESVVVFTPIKDELNVLIAEEQLTRLELKYIVDNILASFKLMQGMFSDSIESSTQKMEAKILGLDAMSDLSMAKLNEALLAPSGEVLKKDVSQETTG